jgi:hypothetical protein
MKLYVVVTSGDEITPNVDVFLNRKEAEESVAYATKDLDLEESPSDGETWRGFSRATHGYVEISVHEKEI